MKRPRHAQSIYLQCGTQGYWTRYYRGRSLRKMGVPFYADSLQGKKRLKRSLSEDGCL